MKKSHIIIIHFFFWFIVLSLNYSFLIFREPGVPVERYLAITVKSFLEVGNFYLFYFLIIPHFFIRHKYLRFFIITILYALVYTGLYAITLSYAYILLKMAPDWSVLGSQYIVATYYTILYIFLGGLFKLAIDGFKSHQQKLQLQQQNVKNELALLRSQINPHFLFNTLNNIHSFIISKNPNSAQAIIKLSDIMRYMLYDAGKEKITLVKEIEYIRSYINLQNYRIEKEGFVKFNISGDPNGLLIPPMLFTPFVENAFKHGGKADDGANILINMIVNEDSLLFEISNSINPDKNQEVFKSEGTGLKNVKRRLELLYPAKHQLAIYKNDDIFTVSLKINLE